jgi:hypothetical protein
LLGNRDREVEGLRRELEGRGKGGERLEKEVSRLGRVMGER